MKAPYYKCGHKTEDGRGRGGYAEYIATREGVELLRGGMVNYIGQRKGSCGLFSDEGVSVDLAKVSQEIDNHSGNVWALIFSLKREDAERLGYNSAAQWMHLLRSRRNDIAKAMHISPENLRWYAAYHNKETNPHAHMMVWSQNPREPYLSQTGIHDIKKVMASDIFRQELLSVYRGQTQARDDLTETFRAKMRSCPHRFVRAEMKFLPSSIRSLRSSAEKFLRTRAKKSMATWINPQSSSRMKL